MKLIKNTCSNLFTGILTFCLALLGFSCDSEEVGREIICEYGTPSAKFIVKGKIISEDTKEPIKNINIKMLTHHPEFYTDPNSIYYPQGSTNNTNDSGEFELSLHKFPEPTKFYLEIEDIDGEANGSFENKLDSVTFDNPVFTGKDGNWYKGSTEKNINAIELKSLPDKE